MVQNSGKSAKIRADGGTGTSTNPSGKVVIVKVMSVITFVKPLESLEKKNNLRAGKEQKKCRPPKTAPDSAVIITVSLNRPIAPFPPLSDILNLDDGTDQDGPRIIGGEGTRSGFRTSRPAAGEAGSTSGPLDATDRIQMGLPHSRRKRQACRSYRHSKYPYIGTGTADSLALSSAHTAFKKAMELAAKRVRLEDEQDF
ncbi:hypothetical protein GGX14DRAFT_392994 [Mycena pura]|uniref:Uncharacterized protein n=1 Tax=Mycena pura TaxID=153505 RepID=A0AAD6YIX5_9AGAR|nr:hypothetical protein GGX14DRAFT_392994 [Mycena pura]